MRMCIAEPVQDEHLWLKSIHFLIFFKKMTNHDMIDMGWVNYQEIFILNLK